MISTINAAAVQPTESKNATVLPFQSSASAVEEKTAASMKKTQAVIDEQTRDQQARKAQEKTPLEELKENEQEVTQEMLDELSTDLEVLHSIGLSFAKHEDTGRTFIKVMNKDTDELIREIPAEDVLNMAAKIDEMIGILFDAKA